MQGEVTTAISAVTVAAIAAGPAYLGLMARRMRQSTESEGALTREAMQHAVERSQVATDAKIDAVRDELRHDIRDVREWQAAHTAEHVLLRERHHGET